MGRFKLELIFFYLFFTVVPSNTYVFFSCMPFVVNTFSTGLEVSSVSWLGQLTVGVQIIEGKLKFSEHVLNVGHEMKTIEETMSIIHQENNHRKINTLEEIKIQKGASSKNMLNDVITGQNDPIYKLLPSQWFELIDKTAQPSN